MGENTRIEPEGFAVSHPKLDKSGGIGMALKALRKMAGLTQAELAPLAGLKRTSIMNIERGNQTLNVRSINAIAAALGYEVRVKFVRRTDVAFVEACRGRCHIEWESINDPPCHPGDTNWQPCVLCMHARVRSDSGEVARG